MRSSVGVFPVVFGNSKTTIAVSVSVAIPNAAIFIGGAMTNLLKKLDLINNHPFASIRRRNSASASLFGVRFPFKYFRYDGSGMFKSLAAVLAFRFPRH